MRAGSELSLKISILAFGRFVAVEQWSRPEGDDMDIRRPSEAEEHGAKILFSPNRFGDRPAGVFRPHEGPATG
jgi:hypothetical protein